MSNSLLSLMLTALLMAIVPEAVAVPLPLSVPPDQVRPFAKVGLPVP